ncbi:MAG: TonB family protein [Thermodesulfobacteriota bacterium]
MKQNKALTLIIGGVAAVLLVVAISGIVFVMKDKPEARKRQVQMVTLVKPPPPPPPQEMQEQPPEPEEVMEEPVPEEAPREDMADEPDAPPPGELLGLDAEGGTGSDGFGLAARKGGRSLIGGNGGRESLLRKYAWYTGIVRQELEELVRRYLEEHGGIPKGELQTVVKIQLDEQGKVNAFKIEGSSGNSEMDRAVAQILEKAAVNEPPPSDMPKIIKLRISSQG